MNIEERAERFKEAFSRLQAEIGKVIVGQREIVEDTLVCFFARGHALLEGVPGLGKTMLVRTMAAACELDFSRIQFKMDDPGLLGIGIQVAGDTIVKAHSHSDQNVAFIGELVRRIISMHAHHANV